MQFYNIYIEINDIHIIHDTILDYTDIKYSNEGGFVLQKKLWLLSKI